MPPSRTPTAILRLRGSWRAAARAAHEPTPDVAIPPCPTHLNAIARIEWNRVAPLLRDMGVLTLVDMGMLAGYCVCFARWVEAEQAISEQGLIVRSPNGLPIQNPYLPIANQAMALMRSFATETGMTPASRSKVQVTPAARTNEIVSKRIR